MYVCTYGGVMVPPPRSGEGRRNPVFISFRFFACKCHMSPVCVCGGTVPCVVWSLPVHEPYIESLGGRVVGAARRRVSGRRDVRSGGCWRASQCACCEIRQGRLFLFCPHVMC